MKILSTEKTILVVCGLLADPGLDRKISIGKTAVKGVKGDM